MKEYETVIGLEVHVELATKTKIFCGCSTAFGGAPNTHTCPVCTGMPGSLPVLNRKVVEYAASVGLATHCEITRYGRFDRKNYFYPDNPQNYQISQLYLPICRNGYVDIETPEGSRRVGIHEIHMEEDAGKLIHDDFLDCSLVDYNRSGVPLIEIVSEPDMRSADDVIAYLEKLRMAIQYLGASDCKLQEGSMRADVNLSVREKGAEKLGTRAEMKNINSFRAIARAIDYERARQIDVLESGGSVVQETLRWDDTAGYTYPMRSKEDAKDYRYFPEPDLVPLVISDEFLDQLRQQMPEFREEKMERYRRSYDLTESEIEQITSARRMADLFEAVVDLGADPRETAKWLNGDILRLLKEEGKSANDVSLPPVYLAKLIQLVGAGTINRNTAKSVLEAIWKDPQDPEVYVQEHGLAIVPDNGALEKVIEEVIAANPKSVADWKSGKKKAVGFLVGQTMKAMKGKADPAAVNRMLSEKLARL